VSDPQRVELGGDTIKMNPGLHTVAEYVGVFLMTRGAATKAPE